MDKHILTNDEIIDDKLSLQRFPKRVATQLVLLN